MSDEERRPRPRKLSLDEIADVEIRTSVKADELRFGKVPKTRVWFEGEPGQRSSSESERDNLPEEVEPDVTYRDIGVRWRARARIEHPADAEEDEPGDAES